MVHRISGSHVGDDLVSDAEHRAVFPQRHFYIVNLITTVASVAQMFNAGLAPFDRPPELSREVRKQQLLLIGLDLYSERSADVRRNDSNFPLRQAQGIGDARSGRMGVRRRRPHGERFFLWIVIPPIAALLAAPA